MGKTIEINPCFWFDMQILTLITLVGRGSNHRAVFLLLRAANYFALKFGFFSQQVWIFSIKCCKKITPVSTLHHLHGSATMVTNANQACWGRQNIFSTNNELCLCFLFWGFEKYVTEMSPNTGLAWLKLFLIVFLHVGLFVRLIVELPSGWKPSNL